MRRFHISAFHLAMMAVIVWGGASASAAQVRETLTNAKIIELVRLGLGEKIIVEKIRQSDCQCDTSTDGMAKLKAARVSDPIIMAMLESASHFSESGPATKPAAGPSAPAAGPVAAGPKELREIEEPGIYLFENGKMTVIEPSVFSGSSYNPLKSAVTFGIKKVKFKAKVRGRSANIQAATTQPVFYFVFNNQYKDSGASMAGLWGVATSPAEFMLVQMDVQPNSRQAVMGEISAYTGTDMGARDKDIREYSFEKLSPGVYKVVPKAALGTGEYAFYYAGTIVGFGFAGGKIFDFGVGK